MDKVKSAELFAKKKHSGMTRKDGNTPYSKHLEDVVNRLKGLGVVDSDLLCAGWLHDTIEDTDVIFDDLYEQFGSKVAVLVSTLTKDMTIPRKQREQLYVKQLKQASYDAKLIKLCDISANLSDLKNYQASKSKKLRQVKQKRHYITVIKKSLLENPSYDAVALLQSVNNVMRQYGQRQINF